MIEKEETIIVDFYTGAYGPTLRIDVHSRRNLEWVEKAGTGGCSAGTVSRDWFHLH